MALYESIASALGEYQPGAGEEISLKIKPANMVAGAASQQTSGPVAAGGSSGSPSVSSLGSAGGAQALQSAAPPVQPRVPAGQQLGKNPQLVAPPMGAYTDDMFEAQQAQARLTANQEYLNILQQLGFVDDTGAFIPGAVEQEAARRSAELNYGQEQATKQVTGEARRGGTFFSGRRAQRQEQATRPFLAALAELEGRLPGQLGGLFQSAMGVRQSFENQLMLLLAEAASRQAAAARQNPTAPPPEVTDSVEEPQAPAPPAPPAAAPAAPQVPASVMQSPTIPAAGPEAQQAAQQALEESQAAGDPPWLSALKARSAAMNQIYGLGDYAPAPANLPPYEPPTAPYDVPANLPFQQDWLDFGVLPTGSESVAI